MGEVVPTASRDWSLNKEKESGRLFWWNCKYSISIWDSNLNLGQPRHELTDLLVWQAFLHFQVASVYKLCFVCHQPEGNEDMKVCCFCGLTVHCDCSREATAEQVAWKPANFGFEAYLRACFNCEDVHIPVKIRANRRQAMHTVWLLEPCLLKKNIPNTFSGIFCASRRRQSSPIPVARMRHLWHP
ncbi:hypothetical protein C4B63_23g190 [Trypanosoma cruzi]|uniref:Uncharacterized protein n=1 Tax=Trypanosoma cruzi TaxID=5693 RepID=A0A2V2VIF2_TRYCR|nr:hypothetical protein C4B63_23g190 [Trypanosoma cruzi]